GAAPLAWSMQAAGATSAAPKPLPRPRPCWPKPAPKHPKPMSDWQPGLFALPPGVDFAHEFVAGLLERMRDQPPEAMARVTIYANASRTLTAMQAAFDAAGPMLMPRMRIVTDPGPAHDSGPLAAPLARRLQLARLIDRLLQ